VVSLLVASSHHFDHEWLWQLLRVQHIFSVLISSVFNIKGGCLLDTQPPEQEDRDGKQKEAPKIQGEMVSDLLPT